jgi:hypothetical protein
MTHCFKPSCAASSTSAGYRTNRCAGGCRTSTVGKFSRLLKRLRLHGLIKKVAHGYKYYVTTFGKDVLTAGLKLRELVIIPQLAYGRVA